MAVTGDKASDKQHKAVATDKPLVTAAELADIDSAINSTASGKKLGATCVVDSGAIAVALGGSPDSDWVLQTTGATVTPA